MAEMLVYGGIGLAASLLWWAIMEQEAVPLWWLLLAGAVWPLWIVYVLGGVIEARVPSRRGLQRRGKAPLPSDLTAAERRLAAAELRGRRAGERWGEAETRARLLADREGDGWREATEYLIRQEKERRRREG